MRLGSLFSGIGGLELGLTLGLGGGETAFQVERDPYALAVLAKHWPETARYTDVCTVTGAALPRIDLLCGGFPCQPHSLAGKRGSSEDDRDLWHEFARLIGETRPRWVVAENVPGLLSSADPAQGRGKGGFFGRVLRDLAHLGFDAEWHRYPAAAVGAHHRRERVFLVAYSSCPRSGAVSGSPLGHEGANERWQAFNNHQSDRDGQGDREAALDDAQRLGRGQGRDDNTQHVGHVSGSAGQDTKTLADAGRHRRPECGIWEGEAGWVKPQNRSEVLADTSGEGLPQPEQCTVFGARGREEGRATGERCEVLADTEYGGREGRHPNRSRERGSAEPTGLRGTPDWAGGDWEQPSPTSISTVRGMADGFPGRVGRLRTLGNAVVPQQAAVIGRAIREAEAYLAEFGVMPGQIVRPEHFRQAVR